MIQGRRAFSGNRPTSARLQTAIPSEVQQLFNATTAKLKVISVYEELPSSAFYNADHLNLNGAKSRPRPYELPYANKLAQKKNHPKILFQKESRGLWLLHPLLSFGIIILELFELLFLQQKIHVPDTYLDLR